MFDLTGRVALVTGAGRGLGRLFANAIAGRGAGIVVTSRRRGGCDETLADLRRLGIRHALAAELDVRDRESIRRLAADLGAAELMPDILINNAGCNIRKSFFDVTEEDWDQVVGTNLKGAYFVTQAFAPHMVAQGYGRIVNIGSVTSVFGYAGIGPYCASRGGMLSLTRSLADELGPSGVTVNLLAPGWFETDQNRVLYQDHRWLAYLVDRIPLKRPGLPGDLAGPVVFLASEESRYVTGQILLVDGGISTGATRATAAGPATDN